MSTLKEIAAKAGVSPGAVSAVMNGKAKERRIAPETCAHIEAVAARLGFQHNMLARSLKVGKSNLIGLVGHSYPTYHALSARAAVQVFTEAGYQITMQDLLWRPEQEAQLVQELLGLRVEGLYIESGAGAKKNDHAHRLLCEQARRGLPMVRLNDSKGIPVDVVTVDRELGMYLATMHVLGLGHRNIVFAVDSNPAPFVQARLKGFRRALKEWGMRPKESHFVRPNLKEDGWDREFEAGRRCFACAVALTPRPTALLATNDFIAMGVIGAALEAGLKVPDDLAVVGFTGYPEAQLSAIPLTTISFPFEAMARHASQMLLERIGGETGKPRTITLSPELTIRRSCGGAADVTMAHAGGEMECEYLGRGPGQHLESLAVA
jgi:LacI family transcriptional regulator